PVCHLTYTSPCTLSFALYSSPSVLLSFPTRRSSYLVTILFKITGSGTQLLASYEHGMQLDGIGPAGSGLPIDDLKQDEPVLLIGGGIGVPPIHFLLEQLNARGVETKTILGF